MTVRHAMNTIVVTVTGDQTLREAARRMTDRGVGAAVVAESEGPSQGMITERDVLQSIGRGEDVDAERVRDHLASELIYAYPGWPLERAAEKMAAAAVRHVIVMDRTGRAIGILSMRDIVSCWTSAGLHWRGASEPTTA